MEVLESTLREKERKPERSWERWRENWNFLDEYSLNDFITLKELYIQPKL